MGHGCWRFALVLSLSASAGWFVATAAAQEPPSTAESPNETVAPAPTQPAPKAPPSKIDIERYIKDAVAGDPSLALPRFKEDVEVRDVYQEALETHVRGVDVECGTPDAGPPSRTEMNPYRGAQIPPYADFAGLARLIGKGLKHRMSSSKPRYFLYAVSRPPTTVAAATAGVATPTDAVTVTGPMSSAPAADQEASVTYILRESPIPENARSLVAGTNWTLVASFRDRQPALATLNRLRRAVTTLPRDVRAPAWTTCPPPRAK